MLNIAAEAERLAELLGVPSLAGLNIVATVPPQHMYGLESSILVPLFSRLVVHSVHPLFPFDVRAALASRRTHTIGAVVPTLDNAIFANTTHSLQKTFDAAGYTLLLARIASHVILPAMDAKTPYQWNDFTLLSVLEVNPYVCAVKADAPKPETRVVVYGDSDFAANYAIRIQGNQDLFVNIVNWAAQQENLISIRPKAPSDSRMTMTARQASGVLWMSLLVIPGLVFGTGIMTWARRR